MNLQPVFSTHQFKVEVLTPTHVGMAQEKHYQRGLDFIVDKKTIYFLKQAEVLRQLKPQDLTDFSTWLATNNVRRIEQFIVQNKLNFTKYLHRYEAAFDENVQEIRRQYADGMGQFFIPGSSIKGAIRSIFYEALKQRHGAQADEGRLFGNITNNLMQGLQVGDLPIPVGQIKVYRIKVFSADRKPEAGEGTWKDRSRQGHMANFNPTQFVTHYESVKSGTTSELRIARLKSDNGNPVLVGKQRHLQNADWLQQQDLVSLIRSHTRRYLEKEKVYYQAYANKDLEAVKSMQERLNNLLARNEEPNACLLRVGANVGYHSITGDWKYPDHVSAWIDSDGQEWLNGRRVERHRHLSNQIKAKTRKFVFLKQADETFSFLPMGYLKLTLLP